MTFLDEMKTAVTPRAALLVIGTLVLQLLFIASYVGALHNPAPKDVPFGVVAPAQAAPRLVSELKGLPGGPLDPRTAAGAADARKKILNRDLDGALIVSPNGSKDTLLVASGGGTVLSSSLDRIITGVEKTQRRSVRTVDVAPASAQDFDGLSAFYLVVGWCVGGYLCASILAISAGSRAANGRRAALRLITMALYSVLGGLGARSSSVRCSVRCPAVSWDSGVSARWSSSGSARSLSPCRRSPASWGSVWPSCWW